jgi:hypothetical protein
MDAALRIVVEMNARMWAALKNALADVTEEEIHWRPVPQANTIGLIVRHLRIEAEWHVDSLERGQPMPTIAVAPSQAAIDAIPNDFAQNFPKLEEFSNRFIALLQSTTLDTLRARSRAAYGRKAETDEGQHFLAYHHAAHLAMHCGQIRAIRNLYCRMRGEPVRFVPENPTYPRQNGLDGSAA